MSSSIYTCFSSRYLGVLLVLLLSLLFISCVHADQWRVDNRGPRKSAKRRSAMGGARMERERERRKLQSSGELCLRYRRWDKMYLDCSLEENVTAFPTIPDDATRVWMAGQGLTNIGVTNILPSLPLLKELHLNGNAIETITSDAFTNIPNVETILLHYNPDLTTIQDGTFAGLTKLKELWINNCGLTTLGANVFNVGLTSLYSLRLSGNNISSFADGQFNNLAAITELDVRGQGYLDENEIEVPIALSPSCCEICAVPADNFMMDNYGDPSQLTGGALVCDYAALDCRDSSNNPICGDASITYAVSAASSLYTVLSRALAVSFVAVASLYLTL